MDCGAGVHLCGVLSLETGLGEGAYKHPVPAVHGLWPETGSFGSSECKKPLETDKPTEVYSCYKQAGETDAELLSFEAHEWFKHGVCAGTKDAADFFHQICDISAKPLQVLADVVKQGGDTKKGADALVAAGYSVWGVSPYTGEIRLATCAGKDGHWQLAALSDFPKVCGDGTAAAPPASPAAAVCVPNQRGPACKTDGECVGKSGCLRCASTGFCTNLPKTGVQKTILHA